MTLKEVQKEIDRLNAIKRELEEQEREAHRQAARQFVGKCYKSDEGNVAKIIGIPRTIHHMTHVVYNPYQFPAVFLNYPDMPREEGIHCKLDEFTPLYYDTIYLDIKNEHPGRSLMFWEDQWEEITQEEFNEEFDRCIEHFKEQINV